MSTVFCGVGKVPKGKTRGNMKECAEIGQIRYYGLKKVDSRIIENALKEKKLKGSGSNNLEARREELMMIKVNLVGKIRKQKLLFEGEKKPRDKKTLGKELDILEKKLAKVKTDLQKIKNEKDKRQQRTKKGSKRVSKKGSKKRVSKRGSKKRVSKKGSKKRGSKKWVYKNIWNKSNNIDLAI